MGFFLSLLELSEQELRSVLNDRFYFSFLANLFIFLDEMFKNSMINGQSFEAVQLFDQFETHGTSYSAVPKIKR